MNENKTIKTAENSIKTSFNYTEQLNYYLNIINYGSNNKKSFIPGHPYYRIIKLSGRLKPVIIYMKTFNKIYIQTINIITVGNDESGYNRYYGITEYQINKNGINEEIIKIFYTDDELNQWNENHKVNYNNWIEAINNNNSENHKENL